MLHLSRKHFSSQMHRIVRNRQRRSMFRGWSRVCLHAASLSAAEGASAAATAIARAARAEAMQKEAQAAVDKAEAWRRAAAASAEVADAREKAQQLSTGVSTLTAQLKRRGEGTDHLVREQQLRRVKMLVSKTYPVTSLLYIQGSSKLVDCHAGMTNCRQTHRYPRTHTYSFLCRWLRRCRTYHLFFVPDHPLFWRTRSVSYVSWVESPMPSRRISLRRRGGVSSRHRFGQGCSSRSDGEGGESSSGEG